MSKGRVEAMAELNNKLVELIDSSKATPLEAILVLELMQNTLTKASEAFIAKTLTESNAEKT